MNQADTALWTHTEQTDSDLYRLKQPKQKIIHNKPEMRQFLNLYDSDFFKSLR